jgi:serine/threonine protein kinase
MAPDTVLLPPINVEPKNKMKTGDVIRDAKGSAYQVGQLLGRGLWGKSYVVRQEDSSVEYVMKCPLSKPDFRGEMPAPDDLLNGCRNALLEQGRLLDEGRWPFLPRLHARFTSADGTPVLLMPRYTTTLEKRIQGGCSLSEVLTTLITTIQHLRLLADGPGLHGNLKPSNILLNDRGDVFLSDFATKSARTFAGRLNAIASSPNRYLAPEIAGSLSEVPFQSVADTYAVGMILYYAVSTPSGGSPGEAASTKLTARGLDKAALLKIKDSVDDRLRNEESNSRFSSRVAERMAAVLNRAISLETTPSPPFRFTRTIDLLPRMQEVLSLIRPEIASVGKVILNRPTASSVFMTDENIGFSVTVAATPGVDNYKEIAPGLALFDEETSSQIRLTESGFDAKKHPSGRFRFAFSLPSLHPGRYFVKVAFAIKGSGHPPVTSEAKFEVRPGAGYVPPIVEPEDDALPFASPSRTAERDAPIEMEPTPLPVAPTTPEWDESNFEELPSIEEEPNTYPDLSEPFPIAPSPTALEKGDLGERDFLEGGHTFAPIIPEPSVTESGSLHSADNDTGASIDAWTDLPLPAPTKAEQRPQRQHDIPEDDSAYDNKLERMIEIMKEDPYVAFMGAGIVLIVVLLITLFTLG